MKTPLLTISSLLSCTTLCSTAKEVEATNLSPIYLKQTTWHESKRALVQAAIQPLPYHDIAGTCSRDENCLCLSCWVRTLKVERDSQLAARGDNRK